MSLIRATDRSLFSTVAPDVLAEDDFPSDFTTGTSDRNGTLDYTPEETTLGYRFDAQCSCFLQTILKTRSSDELLGDDLTENPKPEQCDEQGMQQCVHFCVAKVAHVTHDLDLEKVPITRLNVDVSLGQYLCNQLGSHVLPSRVSLYAKLSCSVKGPRHESRTSHTATTGVSSKQRLFCFRGKFKGL